MLHGQSDDTRGVKWKRLSHNKKNPKVYDTRSVRPMCPQERRKKHTQKHAKSTNEYQVHGSITPPKTLSSKNRQNEKKTKK